MMDAHTISKASDPRVADLVQAGRLRVALFPPQYTKDPVSGELQGAEPGPAFLDIARALVEEGKASGLVQRAIEGAGLRGVQVAPLASPTPNK